MQKLLHKFLVFFIIASFATPQTAHAQDVANLLAQADTLFEQQEYSKAMEVYQTVLAQGKYTPQMLMKMAYVQEGLGKIPQAMYYLTLLNRYSPTEATIQKLADLAAKEQLLGYDLNDEAYFSLFYRKYKKPILVSMGILGCLGLAVLYWLKQRGYNPAVPAVFLSAYGLLLFWLVNFQHPAVKGIVVSKQAFLMKAPSAGSELIEPIGPGHRLRVVGQHDIWYEVDWYNQPAFIRNSNLQLIH